MKKTLTYAITFSALAVALAGCAPVAGAYSAPPSHSSPARTAGSAPGAYGVTGGGSGASAAPPLAAATTKLGSTLVDGTKTLYSFAADQPGSMRSACTGDCLNDWPPVLVTGAAPKIMGVTGTLGTISAVGGGTQLTIDGHPLYTFSGDRAAGDVNGQGINEFGGLWWAVGPSGTNLRSR